MILKSNLWRVERVGRNSAELVGLGCMGPLFKEVREGTEACAGAVDLITILVGVNEHHDGYDLA